MKYAAAAAGFFALTLITPLVSSVRAESAQQDKMKECNVQADAKGLKGEGKGPDRRAFMKQCLSAQPAAAAAAAAKNPQREKMKSCNKEASAKGLKGAERKQFMSGCLKN